jgi:hypothetical protein
MAWLSAQRVWILVVWTFLVWTSRVRNIMAADELSSTGRAIRVAIAVSFVTLAVGTAVGLFRKQLDRRWLMALVGWTILVWTVRGVGMLLDDHEVGFKVVHTVLAAVSIGLAVWCGQLLRDKADVSTPVLSG